jgi:hypothetical protein
MQRVRNIDKDKSFKTYYNIDGERREGQKESENLKDKEEIWRRKAQRNKKDIIITEREKDTHT